MDKLEWREINGLAQDFKVAKEVLERIDISMSYDKAQRVVMEEFDKKWSK